MLIYNSFIFAMWPIWGWLTPFIMFVIFMGGTMMMSFLPGGQIGNLIFWSIMIFLVFMSHMLPHEDVDAGHVHT